MTSSGSPATQATTWHLAILGGYDKRGPWQMPPRTIAISPIGGIDLDLTEASLPDEGATVVKVSLVGGAKLKVPADVRRCGSSRTGSSAACGSSELLGPRAVCDAPRSQR
jgi:hypothetical protein